MTATMVGMTGALVLAGCASVQRPPGGPEDKAPPVVVSASIDTNAIGVRARKLEIRFDEVVSERPAGLGASGAEGLGAIVLVSPRTGTPKVEWHRERITIEPRGGFLPNTTYRITLLPGLADIRGNVSDVGASYIFSTGPSILPFAILGRVFDWQTGQNAQGAIVEAVANLGTPDSLIYVAVTDSVGQFELGPLAAGKYLVRTFIDSDRNRDRGVLEKWDSVTVNVTDHKPSIELLAVQRDTAPIGVQRAEALDSAWIRVVLDKSFDPRTMLQPSLVVVQRTDSTPLQVAAVMTEEQATFLRPRPDSAAQRPAAAPPAAEPVSARPPAARPAMPPPQSVIVVRLNPSTPLRAGQRYVITVRGLRNLVGRTGTSVMTFDGPRPPAAKPPA